MERTMNSVGVPMGVEFCGSDFRSMQHPSRKYLNIVKKINLISHYLCPFTTKYEYPVVSFDFVYTLIKTKTPGKRL